MANDKLRDYISENLKKGNNEADILVGSRGAEIDGRKETWFDFHIESFYGQRRKYTACMEYMNTNKKNPGQLITDLSMTPTRLLNFM